MPRHSLLGLAAAVALAAPAAGQTADEVIARSIEARGGLAKIKAVQSVRMSGTISMGPMDLPIVVEIKRPGSFRTEMAFQGSPAIQAYDGQHAWVVPPTGRRQPEALPAEAAKEMALQADLEGPLVDYKAKGHQVELIGREKTGDGEAYRVEVTLNGGEVETYFVDTRSWLPVRVEAKRTIRGAEIDGESRLGDYRDAGGWKWPHSIENSVKGRADGQEIRFEKIEVNPALDDSRFKMPGSSPKADDDAPKR